MKWVEKFPNYWELVSKSGKVLAIVHQGRKTFFCEIEGTGEKTDFNAYGLFSTVKGTLSKSQKWCEERVK